MPRAAILLLVAILAWAGEAEAPPLPPAAQAALDRLAKAEAKIDADAARQRSSERQKAIKELEKVQQTVTKAGDLDGALAVKNRLDALRKQEEDEAGDLLGEAKAAARDPAKLAVGRWSVTKTNGIVGQIELLADKTARASAGPFVITGIWQIEKERVVIHWGGNPGRWENLAFDGPDRLAGDSHDAGKDGISMVRLKG